MKAWKSTSPEVIEAIEKIKNGFVDARNDAVTWAQENYPLPPKPDNRGSLHWPDGKRGVRTWTWGGKITIAGLVPVTPDEQRDPPAGWRYDKRDHALVPALRQDLGKEHKETLKRLGFTPPDIPGAPNQFSKVKGTQHYFCTWGPRVMEGAAWFKIDGEMDERDEKTIDPEVWQEIKVSEYYRALEDHEAAQNQEDPDKG